MKINYKGRAAYLSWYCQDLLTTSLDSVYGREILCRGFWVADNRQIPMTELLSYLSQDDELLLAMTIRQIEDIVLMQQNDTGNSISIWINIAGQLIADQNLFSQLWQKVLSGLTSDQKRLLVLEICEDDINDVVMIERVSLLKTKGFVIAMDDFGSGHSNLLRLTQIPFDVIKLDLKLLKKVPNDLWAASFYREIVDLCSSKGSLIVAEGVESETQSDFVRWAGVDLLQGFLYSRPDKLAYNPLT